MGKTSIAWATDTWNVVTGCTKVSPGCANCYAERIALRFGRSFEVTLHPEKLDEPLHWVRPRRAFVCSTADLFHPDVPLMDPSCSGGQSPLIDHVFATMARCPAHQFLVLTKRPERMNEYLTGGRIKQKIGLAFIRSFGGGEPTLYHDTQGYPVPYSWPLPNCWLGVSIENDRFVYRADILRQTPAAVRWISAEPLLGPLSSLDLTGINWLVLGGESGPHARPMDPQWALDLIDRAHDAGVAVFVKQASGPRPGMQGDLPDWAFALREYPR